MRQKPSKLATVDILPQELRGRRLTRVEGGLVLVFVVAAVLLLFSFQGLVKERQQTADLKARERRLATAIAQLQPQVQQGDALRKENAALQARLNETRSIQEALSRGRLDWNTVLASVFVSPPGGVELTIVSRSPGQLAVQGVSRDGFGHLQEYYNQLKATPGVTRVTIARAESRETREQVRSVSFDLILDVVGN